MFVLSTAKNRKVRWIMIWDFLSEDLSKRKILHVPPLISESPRGSISLQQYWLMMNKFIHFHLFLKDPSRAQPRGRYKVGRVSDFSRHFLFNKKWEKTGAPSKDNRHGNNIKFKREWKMKSNLKIKGVKNEKQVQLLARVNQGSTI
jgi:hypothetical protein